MSTKRPSPRASRALQARQQAGHEASALPMLPEPFAAWFAARGWTPRPHQLALLEASQQRRSTLLIAPTGAGKTLAGFLPSLVRLSDPGKRPRKGAGLRTLYISPLKALACDVARNLETPIAEMGLKIRTETRSADTTLARRQRQRPQTSRCLHGTPESDPGSSPGASSIPRTACAAAQPARLWRCAARGMRAIGPAAGAVA